MWNSPLNIILFVVYSYKVKSMDLVYDPHLDTMFYILISDYKVKSMDLVDDLH